jgi:hypothetical protein
MTDVQDVIPISHLFFDDAGPHILRATNFPEQYGGTTLAPRDATRVAGRRAPIPDMPAAGVGRYTPARGRELHDLLGTSIAQLGAVSGGTRRTPAPPPPVPIETLLYRGRAALQRALEIRAVTRSTGQTPTSETIDELLDLIALAAE